MQGKLRVAASGSGVIVLAVCGSLAFAGNRGASAAALPTHNEQEHIVGTWVDTVTPNAPIGPFQSTIVFTGSGAVIKATSKAFAAPTADTSEGLGVWQEGAKGVVKMTTQKYLFDATGAYMGRIVIAETDTLHGAGAYNGNAATTV
jgi:hypothetical protein